MSSQLEDVQQSPDHRGIDIQKVGIKDVFLPFSILTKAGGSQTVLGKVRLTVDLPRHYKGTHMSRFSEILDRWADRPITGPGMEEILSEVRQRLQAGRADLMLSFKYFIEKKAPVSGARGLLDYDIEFDGSLREDGYHFILGLTVPFTSVCPCSREISAYGAHNQRGLLRVRLSYEPGEFLWIEDLVELLEGQASCPVYPILKREDEKIVTERAYDNAKFVEDILRDAVLALRSLPRVGWFSIECENFESIHNHNAYAAHDEAHA